MQTVTVLLGFLMGRGAWAPVTCVGNGSTHQPANSPVLILLQENILCACVVTNAEDSACYKFRLMLLHLCDNPSKSLRKWNVGFFPAFIQENKVCKPQNYQT